MIIYQGEELGLSEAEIAFDDLQDPFGKAFYPNYKGRDGCRTPMPWTSQFGGGFSSNKPWLPIPTVHLMKSVEMQSRSKSSHLELTKKLIDVRKKSTPLKMGSYEYNIQNGNLVCVTRRHLDECVQAFIHFGESIENMNVACQSEVLCELGTKMIDGVYAIEPGGFAIFRIQNDKVKEAK